MRGSAITVMGETDLHILDEIRPAHDTDFGCSVSTVINRVAGKHGFDNVHQLALKTPAGSELTREMFLEFKNSPIVHLFTLKGRQDGDIHVRQISVSRYRDGGGFIRVDLTSDMIDMDALLIEACVNFDLPIEEYELAMVDNESFVFYLKHKGVQTFQTLRV